MRKNRNAYIHQTSKIEDGKAPILQSLYSNMRTINALSYGLIILKLEIEPNEIKKIFQNTGYLQGDITASREMYK